MPLFTESLRKLDYSQFTLRGHYTVSEELSRYFRSMMWLGRMDFLLTSTPPPDTLSVEDLLRMNVGAVLLNELLTLSVEGNRLDGMDEIIEFMVGESDNLTSGELQDIITAEGIGGADDLLDDTVYASFHSAIEFSPYSDQKILSSMFQYSFTAEPPPLPVSFRLFGQRFIIDSYIFSKVVFPWIRYQNANIWRPMPDPLDAMFALGNDDALQLIKDELDTYKYSLSLAGLRYLVDAYDDEFWSQSLYNTWLSAIRALNPPADDINLPFFMKTTGWHQQKLNTQLASWSQLRHDNLLYAKQSYTGLGACFYPHSYVEPYPEFYHQIRSFAERAGTYFGTLNAGEFGGMEGIVSYFVRLGSVVDTLETLALKEIEGTPFNDSEEVFLKQMITVDIVGGSGRDTATVLDGWFGDLFFGDELSASQLAFEEDFIVADVHTQPSDAAGTIVGRVLHVGVGEVNLGVYLVEQTPGAGSARAYVGPAMSYYEHITDNFDRLTDERWFDIVDADDVPPRPDWVNIYLTDSTGTRYPQGRELEGEIFTGVHYPDRSQIATFILHQNYPNPFNPVTTIKYALPKSSDVTLTVFNLLGEEVERFLYDRKPAGNHQVTWDASSVSSGIYFYRLQAGDYVLTRKMVLLK